MSADLQLLVIFIWATAVHAHSAEQRWSLAALPLEAPSHQVAALYCDEASTRKSTIPQESAGATSEEPAEESASPKIVYDQQSSALAEHTCTLPDLLPAFGDATSCSGDILSNESIPIADPTNRDERVIEAQQLPNLECCDSAIKVDSVSSLEPEADSEPTNIDTPSVAGFLPGSQESLSSNLAEKSDKNSLEVKKQKLRELRAEEDKVAKKEEAVRRRLEELQQIKENKSPSVERSSRFNRTVMSSPSSSSPPSVAEVGRISPSLPGQSPSPSNTHRPSLQSPRPSDSAPPSPSSSSTFTAFQPAQASPADKKKVLISSTSHSTAPSLLEKAKLRSPNPSIAITSGSTPEEADSAGEHDGTHHTDDELTQEDYNAAPDPELVEKARRLVERKTLLKLAKDATGQVNGEEEDPELKAWKRRARLRNKEAKLRQDVHLPDGAARRREAEKLKKQRMKEQGSLRPKKSGPAP